MASVFFRLDGAFLTGCTWGYDRLHPPHLTRRQPHLDAVRVRRRAREQLGDHTAGEFARGLIVLWHAVYGQPGRLFNDLLFPKLIGFQSVLFLNVFAWPIYIL